MSNSSNQREIANGSASEKYAASKPRVAELTDNQFNDLAAIVYKYFGINLPITKKDLIPRRLNKRLKTLGLINYGQYLDYLQRNWSDERQVLANAITTNLTSFFREAHHFECLEKKLIPKLLEKNKITQKIRIWSAGCSTGEEPYSIAMVLHQFRQQLKGWDVKILATDLDTDILSKAFIGEYQKEQLQKVSSKNISQCFNAVDAEGQVFSITEKLKSMVTFNKLNFFDAWPMSGTFDIIFCRNALIYFDQPTQRRVLDGFASYQSSDDVLVVGHSESLHEVTTDYQSIGQTTYQKK